MSTLKKKSERERERGYMLFFYAGIIWMQTKHYERQQNNKENKKKVIETFHVSPCGRLRMFVHKSNVEKKKVPTPLRTFYPLISSSSNHPPPPEASCDAGLARRIMLPSWASWPSRPYSFQ